MEKRKIVQVNSKSSVNIKGLTQKNKKVDAFLSFILSRTFVSKGIPMK